MFGGIFSIVNDSGMYFDSVRFIYALKPYLLYCIGLDVLLYHINSATKCNPASSRDLTILSIKKDFSILPTSLWEKSRYILIAKSN